MVFDGGNISDSYYNVATHSMVKKCVKDLIWPSNKFLLDSQLQAYNITEDIKVLEDGGGNMQLGILGILLKFTKKINVQYSEKVLFWKVYSPLVQKELNELKTNCARKIRDVMMKGIVFEKCDI